MPSDVALSDPAADAADAALATVSKPLPHDSARLHVRGAAYVDDILEPSGTLHGKDALRAYWGKGLPLIPNLHFTLIDTYVSPDSVVVFYQNERGGKICEYLRLDAEGKIRQGSANHLAH